MSQPVDVLDALRERASVPDLFREGPFDIRRDRPHHFVRSGDGYDFSSEYGVQLHDPRLLEYVGAPESAGLLSRSPE